MLAAHAGHHKFVETLIAHRAKLNITAKFGLSALMLAIVAGHVKHASFVTRLTWRGYVDTSDSDQIRHYPSFHELEPSPTRSGHIL
jgi:hypothetical protein